MKHRSLGTSALLALLISAGLATAQTTTTPTYETSVTTGMVGFAPATQTAQLNVLNTGGIFITNASTTASTPIAACPLELEFLDAQGNTLKSLQVTNVAAGTATSLTLKLADLPVAVATALRLGIRGVVKSNPISSGPVTGGTTGSGPAIPVPSSICTIVPTLELFDTSNGVTQMFTSDTRPFGTPVAVPLTTTN